MVIASYLAIASSRLEASDPENRQDPCKLAGRLIIRVVGSLIAMWSKAIARLNGVACFNRGLFFLMACETA